LDLRDIFDGKKILNKLSDFYYKKYEPAIYKDINLESLLVYGIYILKKNNIDISEENVYIQTFLLFPKRFSLINFPFFPNILQLNQSWFRSRSNKNFITGNFSEGFKLTRLGLREAKKVESMINEPKTEEGIRADVLIPSDKILIDLFKTHQGFLKFQETKEINISELEFCLLIKVRQTASHTLFNSRFLELEQIFTDHNEEELSIFLQELKKEFNYFFISVEENSSLIKKKENNKK
jgi:hypothetical protein